MDKGWKNRHERRIAKYRAQLEEEERLKGDWYRKRKRKKELKRIREAEYWNSPEGRRKKKEDDDNAGAYAVGLM